MLSFNVNKRNPPIMNIKLENALNRLKHILPIKDRQDRCEPQIKLLHQKILQSFVTQGRILNIDEMTECVDNTSQAIDILSENDMVIFSESGEPIGAYPFTMSTREHMVLVNGFNVHAMCALDALAIAPMFNTNTDIRSQCRVTGETVSIKMSGETVQNQHEAGNIFFGITWGASDSAISCADSLCLEMIFLKDYETAQKWQSDDIAERETFTLQEAVQFSSRFFSPLLS